MSFPIERPRRLRATPAIRRMVRETTLTPADLVYPMFIIHGKDQRRAIQSMPGIYQQTADCAVKEAREAYNLGIPAVLLFGLPEHKDALGSENFAPDGVVQQAVMRIKDALPELAVITDVCMCEYTDHGHCGVVKQEGNTFSIENDATLNILQKVALSHARSGADIVAPSGMMDGMVAAMRTALDGEGFAHVNIMSYAIKYASVFYSPFREAAEGAPQFGDRKSHQMDPANRREALREMALDVAEGADYVMVKPALAYLDILREVRDACRLPVAAYNVSGEYAMIKAAAAQGWLDEKGAVMEVLTSIKRAGADIILTYFALSAATWL